MVCPSQLLKRLMNEDCKFEAILGKKTYLKTKCKIKWLKGIKWKSAHLACLRPWF
jgi:hypothetical protein